MVGKLLDKKVPEKEKQKSINQILNRLEGILHKVVHKRDGSKIVQACVKYGTSEQRNKVFDLLIKSGEFDEIVKSKYGHFTALKMMKHLDSKEQKDAFFRILLKNTFFFVSHVEAAKVLDRFARDKATPHQLNELKQVFDKKHDTQEIDS